MRILVMIGFLWIVCSGTGTLSIAAENTVEPADEPVDALSEKPPEPEEHARLAAEGKRLSETAASCGCISLV